MRPCRATRAGTQAPPLPRSVIFFHAIPYKQNNHLHTILSNEINRPSRNLPKRNRRGGACVPARTSAQRRFHTKNTCIVCGDLTMDAPLRGDTGGYTGAAPANLHQTTRYAITSSHCTFDSPRQSHGVSIPHRIAHSIAPNHAVCHYPIGVILSIAQGWQVQRSLPWVMVQGRMLPPWGLYFFSSHIITTRGE